MTNKGTILSPVNRTAADFAVSALQQGNFPAIPLSTFAFRPDSEVCCAEEEPKQPCKTCGKTNWNPLQTRRQLFKNAAIAGIGLVTAGSLLVASAPPAIADPLPESLDEIMARCRGILSDELVVCGQQFPGSDDISKGARFTCEAIAHNQYAICLADGVLEYEARAAKAILAWLQANYPLLYEGIVIGIHLLEYGLVIVIVVLAWPEIVAAAEASAAYIAEQLALAAARQAAAATLAALEAALEAAQGVVQQALQGLEGALSPLGAIFA